MTDTQLKQHLVQHLIAIGKIKSPISFPNEWALTELQCNVQ